MTAKKQPYIQYLYSVLIVALTLLPAANILHIITSTGANNPSNDDLHTVGLVDQILSGGYSWKNYFQDTLETRHHSFALLMLFRLAIVKLTHWNIYAELLVGFIFAVIKVILLYLLIAPIANIHARRWLWPVLSALVFSTSQISVFTYGTTALQLGLIHIGIIGGILVLSRSKGSWLGIAGMVLGGLVASWSGGGGLLSWPLLLAGLILFKYRRTVHYVIWVCGVALASWPYLAYGLLEYPNTLMGLTLEKIKTVVTAIGYPFLNQIGFGGLAENNLGLLIGLFGLLLAGIGVSLRIITGTHTQERALLSVLMIGWGLLSAIQTAISRTYLAPWYTTSFMPFWIGLTGLGFNNLVDRNSPLGTKDDSPKFIRRIQGTWAITVFVVVAVLYSTSNLTYQDKSFYLSSRSPASAACLRNYNTAPTYCEGLVFQWGIGNPTYLARLAWPLEKHQLSVFAPTQQWTMQGDFVLDRVEFNQYDSGAQISWLNPQTNKPAFWNDYHHLNLLIPPQNSVNWKVTLPDNLSKALLTSAIKSVSFAPSKNEPQDFDFEINLETEHEQSQLLLSRTLHADHTTWQNVKIPLEEFAGETIILTFKSETSALDQSEGILLRYPTINLNLNSKTIDEPLVTPSNTSLFPNHLELSSKDFMVSTSTSGDWIVDGAAPVPGSEQVWVITSEPTFVLKHQLDLCLDEYSKIYVRLGVSENIKPRAAQIYYKLNQQADFVESQSLWIPLLADGLPYTYTYDLKLLPLPKAARLTGLRLDPVVKGAMNGPNLVEIEEIGFLRANDSQSNACNS